MKNCTKCGQLKELKDFYKLKTSIDGHRPDCKECHRNLKKQIDSTVEGRAYAMASSLFKRIGSNRKKDQCYKGIENRLGATQKEVQILLLEHFTDDIVKLMEVGETPSIDRLDSTGHYELGNIRIISKRENELAGLKKAVEKTSKKVKVTYPDGTERVFKSVSETSRELAIKRDTVITNAKHGTVSRKGFRFEYVFLS